MLSSAAAADTIVAKDNTPKDGKYEVVMPVAFPDEAAEDAKRWVGPGRRDVRTCGLRRGG